MGAQNAADMCASGSDCILEKGAQRVARDGANFFNNFVGLLNKLPGVPGNSQVGILLGKTVITGMLGASGQLATIARDLANGLAAEADHPLAWFTGQNVSHDASSIQASALKGTATGVLEGLIAAVIGAGVTALTDGTATAPGAALFAGGITYADVVATGSATMDGIALFQYILPHEDILDSVIDMSEACLLRARALVALLLLSPMSRSERGRG